MAPQIRTTVILSAVFMLGVESLSQGLFSDCPTYWTAFGDSCYRFFGQRVDLNQARYNCRIQGSGSKFAYLASIHSKEENDYVAALFKSYTDSGEDTNWHAWIGLTDEDEEGSFVWTDGTDTDFTNWASGEPGGGSSQQGAVMMSPNHRNYGLWHDATVTNAYRYICKLPRY